MSAMRCPRCWKDLPDSARFCRRCGLEVRRLGPPPPPPPAWRRTPAPVPARTGSRSGWLLFIVVIWFAAAGVRSCRKDEYKPPAAPVFPYRYSADPAPRTTPRTTPELNTELSERMRELLRRRDLPRTAPPPVPSKSSWPPTPQPWPAQPGPSQQPNTPPPGGSGRK